MNEVEDTPIDEWTLLANLIWLVRRLLDTEHDQPGLILDRMNDLSVALWEYENLP